MCANVADLDAVRREIIDGARNGNPACALALLKEAHAALDATTDPELEYLRDCVGRMLAGEDPRKAFNLGNRKQGRPPYPLKPHRDALFRWEVQSLARSGNTVEEAIYKVAEKYDVSADTIRGACWPR